MKSSLVRRDVQVEGAHKSPFAFWRSRPRVTPEESLHALPQPRAALGHAGLGSDAPYHALAASDIPPSQAARLEATIAAAVDPPTVALPAVVLPSVRIPAQQPDLRLEDVHEPSSEEAVGEEVTPRESLLVSVGDEQPAEAPVAIAPPRARRRSSIVGGAAARRASIAGEASRSTPANSAVPFVPPTRRPGTAASVPPKTARLIFGDIVAEESNDPPETMGGALDRLAKQGSTRARPRDPRLDRVSPAWLADLAASTDCRRLSRHTYYRRLGRLCPHRGCLASFDCCCEGSRSEFHVLSRATSFYFKMVKGFLVVLLLVSLAHSLHQALYSSGCEVAVLRRASNETVVALSNASAVVSTRRPLGAALEVQVLSARASLANLPTIESDCGASAVRDPLTGLYASLLSVLSVVTVFASLWWFVRFGSVDEDADLSEVPSDRIPSPLPRQALQEAGSSPLAGETRGRSRRLSDPFVLSPVRLNRQPVEASRFAIEVHGLPRDATEATVREHFERVTACPVHEVVLVRPPLRIADHLEDRLAAESELWRLRERVASLRELEVNPSKKAAYLAQLTTAEITENQFITTRLSLLVDEVRVAEEAMLRHRRHTNRVPPRFVRRFQELEVSGSPSHDSDGGPDVHRRGSIVTEGDITLAYVVFDHAVGAKRALFLHGDEGRGCGPIRCSFGRCCLPAPFLFHMRHRLRVAPAPAPAATLWPNVNRRHRLTCGGAALRYVRCSLRHVHVRSLGSDDLFAILFFVLSLLCSAIAFKQVVRWILFLLPLAGTGAAVWVAKKSARPSVDLEAMEHRDESVACAESLRPAGVCDEWDGAALMALVVPVVVAVGNTLLARLIGPWVAGSWDLPLRRSDATTTYWRTVLVLQFLNTLAVPLSLSIDFLGGAVPPRAELKEFWFNNFGTVELLARGAHTSFNRAWVRGVGTDMVLGALYTLVLATLDLWSAHEWAWRGLRLLLVGVAFLVQSILRGIGSLFFNGVVFCLPEFAAPILRLGGFVRVWRERLARMIAVAFRTSESPDASLRREFSAFRFDEFPSVARAVRTSLALFYAFVLTLVLVPLFPWFGWVSFGFALAVFWTDKAAVVAAVQMHKRTLAQRVEGVKPRDTFVRFPSREVVSRLQSFEFEPVLRAARRGGHWLVLIHLAVSTLVLVMPGLFPSTPTVFDLVGREASDALELDAHAVLDPWIGSSGTSTVLLFLQQHLLPLVLVAVLFLLGTLLGGARTCLRDCCSRRRALLDADGFGEQLFARIPTVELVSKELTRQHLRFSVAECFGLVRGEPSYDVLEHPGYRTRRSMLLAEEMAARPTGLKEGLSFELGADSRGAEARQREQQAQIVRAQFDDVHF